MKLFYILLFTFSYIFSFNVMAENNIPTSYRFKRVKTRIKPKLQELFKRKKLKYGAPIYIRIFKKEKELQLWVKKDNKFVLLKTYTICTYGWGTLGPKLKQGDGQAPEGFYYVKPKQMNPSSKFHLSFNLGYPNQYDSFHKRTGSALMVHGSCVSIGCYAMTDARIDEIYTIAYAALNNGQGYFRVHIFPFKMTGQNMSEHKKSQWYSFWENLKQGYDFFEKNNHPPNVKVKDGKYVFN